MKVGNLVICPKIPNRIGIVVRRRLGLPEHWHVRWFDPYYDSDRIQGEQDLEVISESG